MHMHIRMHRSITNKNETKERQNKRRERLMISIGGQIISNNEQLCQRERAPNITLFCLACAYSLSMWLTECMTFRLFLPFTFNPDDIKQKNTLSRRSRCGWCTDVDIFMRNKRTKVLFAILVLSFVVNQYDFNPEHLVNVMETAQGWISIDCRFSCWLRLISTDVFVSLCFIRLWCRSNKGVESRWVMRDKRHESYSKHLSTMMEIKYLFENNRF